MTDKHTLIIMVLAAQEAILDAFKTSLSGTECARHAAFAHGCLGQVLDILENTYKTDKELMQQSLEALKMMRDKYDEYACHACDRADTAIYALKNALPEVASEQLQLLPIGVLS